MIIDENQRRSGEEIEERFRLECSKTIGNERGAIVWPNDTQDVRDRLAEFQLVYLSPSWLDTHSDRERQEQGMQRYIEQCGNGQRRYRNGLALAIPDRRMVEAARNAVRLILTLELVQSQSTQRQLSPQQEAELVERKRNAENELKGAISQLYPVVYTPQNSEQRGQTYVLDALTVQSYSSAPQLHTRLKEALRNRVVWDSVQPSKIAAQVQLNEQQPVERQHYAVSALVSCFFSYYSFAHIWDEHVVRRAIVVGIKNRTFAYVANARSDEQGNLHFGGPVATTIQFGKDVPTHEIDMGEGAFLLSAAYATQLLTPPKVEPVVSIPADTQPGHQSPPAYSPPAEGGSKTEVNEPPVPTLPTALPARPVAPGRGGQRYHLQLNCRPSDFFEVMKALEKLNDRAISMTIAVVATAKPGEAFVANTMHNLVVEPMIEESDVFVGQELVEE